MSYFNQWWKENKPEGIPVDCYHAVKEVCRSAWERSADEENARCGLIAETWPFSPTIGKQIAATIYRGRDD